MTPRRRRVTLPVTPRVDNQIHAEGDMLMSLALADGGYPTSEHQARPRERWLAPPLHAARDCRTEGLT